LALYAPDGRLVGWKAVTAKDPIALAGPDAGGALASTGANGDEVVGLGGVAAVLVLLGTAFMVSDRRRRKHDAR
jgi:LPXTG-motif cell wall-anchored protein